MTRREREQRVYLDCHKAGYYHIRRIDEQNRKHRKRGMSKVQFRKKLLGDLGYDVE